jgi:hypothetical protein
LGNNFHRVKRGINLESLSSPPLVLEAGDLYFDATLSRLQFSTDGLTTATVGALAIEDSLVPVFNSASTLNFGTNLTAAHSGLGHININLDASISITNLTVTNISKTGASLTLSTITSGDLVLSSASTTSTALDINSSGGIDVDATLGNIDLNAADGYILLNANGTNKGITLDSTLGDLRFADSRSAATNGLNGSFRLSTTATNFSTSLRRSSNTLASELGIVEAINTAFSSSWAAVTSNISASAGDKLMADTTGGVFTITLPSSASTGDYIRIMDPRGSWATNNLTIAKTGLQKINGVASNFTASAASREYELVYYAATDNWILLKPPMYLGG